MASSTFISWICHFWARFWLNFNFGDFRAYFGYFSLVKIDFFEIYFQSWRIKLRVLKFFRPILIIKRHQKNTQAKLFEKFASRQHALMYTKTSKKLQGCFLKSLLPSFQVGLSWNGEAEKRGGVVDGNFKWLSEKKCTIFIKKIVRS